jgi:hypothetical protein
MSLERHLYHDYGRILRSYGHVLVLELAAHALSYPNYPSIAGLTIEASNHLVQSK